MSENRAKWHILLNDLIPERRRSHIQFDYDMPRWSLPLFPLLLLATFAFEPAYLRSRSLPSFTLVPRKSHSVLTVQKANPETGSMAFQNDPDMFIQRNNQWIILVDDEEYIRISVGDYLYDRGFQVTACSDSDAVLELLEDPSQAPQCAMVSSGAIPRLPDIIISDIRMAESRLDGVELLKTIRLDERWERIPLILLTAKSMTDDRIAGYNAGADAYIPKPFDPEELLAIVDAKIARCKREMASSLDQELQQIKRLVKQSEADVIETTEVYLTPVEREVLHLLCLGKTNKAIADKRGTGVAQTAKTIRRLYQKTNMKTRTQLVRWGVKTGHASLA